MALSGTKAQEASLGQYGSIFTDSATAAVVPPDGYIICAITFMADTVLKADGGLVAENSGTNSKRFISTQNAAHTTGAGDEGTGGIQIANNNIFPKGLTIYGRWIQFQVKDADTDGGIIIYLGPKH
mgnify:CR=1 FL=1|tara:strand:+ start:3955 stop:4332 length:378 start_codon:yes stop_codon:yes gene_type:complete